MSVMGEIELISILRESKKVLLLEPPYKSTYMPLGLAKISSLIKAEGGEAVYSRTAVPGDFNLICITTCFTTDSEIVLRTIRECKRSLFLRDARIIVGGIFASLMPEYIVENTGVDVFVGCSDVLDSCLPDYRLSSDVKPPFDGVGLLFTTRGCPNRCPYCMVPKMERECKIIRSWKNNIEGTDRKDFVVFDNNILAFPEFHFSEVVRELNKNKKRVLFDNGFDCRLVTDNNAKELASLKYFRNGFRIAFDRMGDDGFYQTAMEKVIAAGLKVKGNSFSYVLYNFDDTPQEAYYRAQECWKYGSNPYLMEYRPLNSLKKSVFVGKYWTRNLLKAFKNWGVTFGYNRGDRTFEGWIKGMEGIILTDEDWDKWHYKR